MGLQCVLSNTCLIHLLESVCYCRRAMADTRHAPSQLGKYEVRSAMGIGAHYSTSIGFTAWERGRAVDREGGILTSDVTYKNYLILKAFEQF